MAEFSEIVGKTVVNIKGGVGSDKMTFLCDDGTIYAMYHDQDCCENVSVEDIDADLGLLIGSPVLVAEESTSDTNPPGVKPEYQDSFTWTFYKLATAKGHVTIRWYGESNGYYSERVEFNSAEPTDGLS